MAYIIKRSDGTTLTTVAEQQIVKDAAPVALIGRGGVKYGQDHAENFVHLLENFASDTPPALPMVGMFWYAKSSRIPYVWDGTNWNPILVATSNANGLTMAVAIQIDADTSAVAFISGNKIISLTCSEAVSNALLPVSATVGTVTFEVRARFPNGIVAGINLATDAADYMFNGRVPVAERAQYVGGESPLGAVSIHKISGVSILVFTSQGRIGAVWSHASISTLPSTVAIGGTNFAFASRFPYGLISGLTLATDADVTYAIAGYATTQALATSISAEGTARASAIDGIKVWVDQNSATALKYTELEATFTTATGTQSIAQAVNYLKATASSGGAAAEQITALETTFKTITGTTTVAQAVQQLKTNSDAGSAASTAVTTLNSAFTNATGISNTAQAIQTMWTKANETTSVAGWGVKLDSNGWWTGIEAINGGQSQEYIKITTDNFIIGRPGQEVIPFEVRNGVVYMKQAVIENLSIGTDKLSPNSLTATAYFSGNYGGLRASQLGAVGSAYVQFGPSYSQAKVAVTNVPADSKTLLILSVNGQQRDGDIDRARFVIRRYDQAGNYQVQLPGTPIGSFPNDYAVFTWPYIDNDITASNSYEYRVFMARATDHDGDLSDAAFYEVNIVAMVVKK